MRDELSKKKDIQQVNAVAREFNMTEEERREFGDFLEEEKASGRGGTKNECGDFTYEELRRKAREFLGR
ncbi:hypothetical protein WA1_22405 [Scytonema hofmannii PCC 7110]|uniref:Uncharacterized protein n=1 Tax=Scytonema hofmannii PCC 7110 TaxID=128403 RepID=A0A139X9U0_9CYAN|nr:hypothetical protein [Scytonema hofmannii]KYC41445.1 hypothetical protein WA1_22405 [Scytonema hofmannii PCC 7110]